METFCNDFFLFNMCVPVFLPVDQWFAIRVVVLEQDFECQSSSSLNALF